MKRLITALFASLVLMGSVPAAFADDDDRGRSGRWGSDDRWEDRDDRDGRDVPWRRHRDRDDDRRKGIDPRYLNDPLVQTLQSTYGIEVNNYYSGGRYRTSGQVFDRDILRIVNIHRDGTYDVWFNGRSYPAYTRTYRGKMLLYVGSAPTGPGYLYELILR